MAECLKNILRGPFLLPWLLLVLVMPLFPVAVPWAAMLVVVSSLFRFREFRMDKQKIRSLGPWILLYAFYGIGLFYTENMERGWISMERKLSLLVFPVLFIFLPAFDVHKRNLMQWLLVAGVILNSMLSYSEAAGCYFESGSRDCWHSSALSFQLHPTYNAFYTLTALSVVLYNLLQNGTSFKKRLLLLSLGIWLMAFVVLLASKAGLLGLAILLFAALIYAVVRSGNYRWLSWGAAGFVVIIIAIRLFSPITFERFTATIGSSQMSEEELFSTYASTTESNAVRRMIWIVSGEIIADHPLGVGTGDVYPLLEKKYTERQMTGALERQLNAHSQYIQTTIALGYPGLLVLLFALVSGILYAWKRNPLQLIFLILFAVNIAFESMLEVQAGVVFFAVMLGVFTDGGVEGRKVTR